LRAERMMINLRCLEKFSGMPYVAGSPTVATRRWIDLKRNRPAAEAADLSVGDRYAAWGFWIRSRATTVEREDVWLNCSGQPAGGVCRLPPADMVMLRLVHLSGLLPNLWTWA